MIRFFGIILIFISFAWTGFTLSNNIKNKYERLIKERKMLEEITILIRYNLLTVKEIINELYQSDFFSEFDFLKSINENTNKNIAFYNVWESSIKMDCKLSDEEKKIFLELGATLGTTDTDGQLSTINIYKIRIDKMIETESEKYKVKGKMYRSLGIMFGAMIGILIV